MTCTFYFSDGIVHWWCWINSASSVSSCYDPLGWLQWGFPGILAHAWVNPPRFSLECVLGCFGSLFCSDFLRRCVSRGDLLERWFIRGILVCDVRHYFSSRGWKVIFPWMSLSLCKIVFHTLRTPWGWIGGIPWSDLLWGRGVAWFYCLLRPPQGNS